MPNLQYGRVVVETIYVNHKIAKEVRRFVDIVRVKDDKDVLAEFLKLLDRQKSGEIDQIGLQVVKDPETGNIRVERSWCPMV